MMRSSSLNRTVIQMNINGGNVLNVLNLVAVYVGAVNPLLNTGYLKIISSRLWGFIKSIQISVLVENANAIES